MPNATAAEMRCSWCSALLPFCECPAGIARIVDAERAALVRERNELRAALLAARRETETKDALLCEIAQAAIRAVDSPNFNGPRYRTALRQIAALAATPEEK